MPLGDIIKQTTDHTNDNVRKRTLPLVPRITYMPPIADRKQSRQFIQFQNFPLGYVTWTYECIDIRKVFVTVHNLCNAYCVPVLS